MPLPIAPSSNLLAKCTSTLFCYIRFAPFWLFALLVILWGLFRNNLSRSNTQLRRVEVDKATKVASKRNTATAHRI